MTTAGRRREPTPERRLAPSLPRRWLWRGLGTALGLVLVGYLGHRLGGRRLLERVGGVGPRLGWLVACYAAGTAVVALPWRWLMPRASRPGLADTLSNRFAVASLNAVLPLGIYGRAHAAPLAARP